MSGLWRLNGWIICLIVKCWFIEGVGSWQPSSALRWCKLQENAFQAKALGMKALGSSAWCCECETFLKPTQTLTISVSHAMLLATARCAFSEAYWSRKMCSSSWSNNLEIISQIYQSMSAYTARTAFLPLLRSEPPRPRQNYCDGSAGIEISIIR